MLSQVVRIAWEAGGKIMPFFRNDCSHYLKEDRSPVTEADFASNAFLVDALRALTPDAKVISEESAVLEALDLSAVAGSWVIDPLDGTKGFLKGKREFTINIAFMRDGGPFLGVVHAPALNLTYWAMAGKGAWKQEGQGEPETAVRIQTRPADVRRLTVVASKDHRGPNVVRLLQKLPSPSVTSIGSSLKFCLVAEGKADLYFRDLPTMEWDTAAAQCIVEAAGGLVLGMDGERLRYGKPDLRNTGFVAVGDPNFNWSNLVQGSENKNAFRAFFSEICR